MSAKILPSYKQLFGDLDFKKGDDARTVYSPAAYLTDLLQLLEDNFENADFDGRRSDIKELFLNAQETFGEVPYLDIVNRVLENKIGGNVYQKLHTARYPFNLPFDLENERIKKHLNYLNVSPSKLHGLFALNTDQYVIARESLGLSVASYDLLTKPSAVALLKKCYNLPAGDSLNEKRTKVSDFLKTAGMSGPELRELLFQNLTMQKPGGKKPADYAHIRSFFTNLGLGGYAKLDDKEERIVWSDRESGVPDAWFDKANRLIRLSKSIGISTSDVDLILRSCCGNKLDKNAIMVLAVIADMHKKHELPIDVICSLFADINFIGQGNSEEPEDLFNRLFNARFAEINKNVISVGSNEFEAYNDYENLECRTDIRLPENKEFMLRIQKALGVSAKQLNSILENYNNNTELLKGEIGLKALSLLHRLSKLTELLDISFTDLFGLFDVLDKDPAIKLLKNLNVLVRPEVQFTNCYSIIEGGDSKAMLWLTQHLVSLSQWMQQYDFSVEELQFILSGSFTDVKAKDAAAEEKLSFLNTLYQQVKQTFFTQKAVETNLYNARTSRIIYNALSGDGSMLVSKGNKGILNFNEAQAGHETYKAISTLNTITPEDFKGLGIEYAIATKIFDNLILRSYLNADGVVLEEAFPEAEEGFSVATDFSGIHEPLFNLLHAKLVDENEDPSGGDVELEIYPSDLIGLPFSETQLSELYDNLKVNGYIEEDGDVTKPAFFASKENAKDFKVNSDIQSYSGMIYQRIQKQYADFNFTIIPIIIEDFSELKLKEFELANLIENLQFNDYLDEEKNVVAKEDILALTADNFSLALEFYPLRHKILAILKQKVQKVKDSYLALSASFFAKTGQNVAAGMVFKQLSDQGFVNEGRLSEAGKEFFMDVQNARELKLGISFTAEDNKAVFNAVAGIIQSIEKYEIASSSFIEIGLDSDDIEEVVSVLKKGGGMDGGGFIPENSIPYFTNINNALEFNVEGFEDYNKDIYFILHAQAKAVKECIDEVSGKLKTLAEQQEMTLFAGLQEYLGIDADTAKVIFNFVFRKPSHKVEEFILPVLGSVDRHDVLPVSPKNNKFNSAFHRMKQFAYLVSKVGLSAQETNILFHDQDLVEKYPENIELPKGLANIDAMVTKLNGSDYVTYLFKGNRYWVYSNDNYNLLTENAPLSQLSDMFKNISQVDAAFVDNKDTAWIISGPNYFTQKSGEEKWELSEKVWGSVQNNFEDPEKIDASFVDGEGKTFLFAGDQYVRYSQASEFVDEGYPKKIKDNWGQEISGINLPERFAETIDAAFESTDKKLFFFKDDKFTSTDLKGKEKTINSVWGKLKNALTDSGSIDAAVTINGSTHLFSGDQVAVYSNHLENDDVKVDDGFPLTIKSHIPGLPVAFQAGIDGGFTGFDNKVYLFKDEKCSIVSSNLKQVKEVNLTDTWGKIRNNIEKTGSVSAAFVGLDGKTYLFSGNQFYRYSGSDYSKVDEGYPLAISTHWGGLDHVDAAFIMDGKTYLFSQGVEGMASYVRYSTNDYSTPDEGYPKVPNDNWWNLPFKLVESGFDTPDSVFIGKDGATYLFKGKQFISFDNIQRWWSEPENLQKEWDSIPFASVNAAFTGKDGKTYMFSGKRHIRYSDKNYNKIDDRYPKPVNKHWGIITNNIVDNEKIDAGLIVNSIETVDGEDISNRYIYVFSGNQFFRYSGDSYTFVDEGYPRTISSSLNKEPRFQNLTNSIDRVKSSFADRRNVYLFTDSDLHIISDTTNRYYPAVIKGGASSAFMNDGSLYLENAKGWFKANAIETTDFRQEPELPSALRTIPEGYQNTLNAVLVGTDGNTYLFKNDSCYDTLLEKAFPIKEQWGRTQNNFYIDNKVDAGFFGEDGKLHMFSGNQFVSYTIDSETGNAIPQFVDENPKSLSEVWGGLSHVDLAFVRDGKTFLLEKADADGNFRFVSYSTADYSKPDQEAPEAASLDWWKIPTVYAEEGFDSVDAVLFDKDNMFLLKGNDYIQYNKTEDLWSYPKPLSRIFRGGLFEKSEFGELVTAFNGPDGSAYFFTDDQYASHRNKSFSELEDIKNRWGIVRNNIVQNGAVDAAFVFDGSTYLFSGDQYVRYTGNQYRFVDEHYPKTIAEDLHMEKCFSNMSDSTRKFMESLAQDGAHLDAIVADKRSVYLIKGQSCHVVSVKNSATYPTSMLGVVKNNIQENNKIDAAFVNKKGETLLLSGDQYVKYTETDYTLIDSGYPKLIRQNLVKEENLVLVSGSLGYEVDAAFIGNDGKYHFFKGKSYFSNGNAELPRRLEEKSVKGNVGRVRNNFLMMDYEDESDNMSGTIDAVIVNSSGTIYAFSNDQYIAYSDIENEYVDEGYPKLIRNNWGDLPVGYEASVDGGFVFEGKTYLTKDDEYVRYSDPTYKKVDGIYPQKFINRWGNWADYLLSDLVTISRFKQLQEDYQGDDNTLADFFQSENGPTAEPYQMLADLFGWDVEEVKWMKRKNGFLTDQGHLEVKFNIELVVKMFDVFQTTEKMSSSPTLVFRNVWQRLYGTQPSKVSAANELYKYLGNGNSEKDWEILKSQIHDEMNLLKRDALVPFVVNMLKGTKGIQNARDLFEHLLIDVEMGSCMSTSDIKEAIAAIQLYFHRYFVNLEEMEIRGDNDEYVRTGLKGKWKWMKNYRVWEANRKVFLYPENYIRPELRGAKTPEFKKLEEALLQGEITQESAAKSYRAYLDGFAVVGNLIIAGANIYDQGDDQVLLLFGRTRTEPMQYYCRTALFKANGGIIWEPWYKIDIQINSTRVFPVYTFGRTMLFWVEIDEIEVSDGEIETKGNKTVIDNSRKKYEYKAAVKYSFQHFNGDWAHPQNVKRDIKVEYKIDAAYAEADKLTVFSGKYCLITTAANPHGDVKLIKEAFPNLNTNFQAGLDAVANYNNKKYYFKENLVIINSAAPRYTHHIFPHFVGEVEAAFEVDNLLCLINRSGRYMFYEQKRAGFEALTTSAIHQYFPFLALFFGIPVHTGGSEVPKFGHMPPVDAVFRDENEMLYMVRNGQFECFIGSEFKPVDGFPQPVKGNLSFNMDNFFNKLHAVEFTEKGQEYTQITYTTPKDAILLYGKLADDFKFFEGNVKSDYGVYLIMAWENYKRTALTLSYKWRPRLVRSINDVENSVYPQINNLILGAEAALALPESNEDETEEKRKRLETMTNSIVAKAATLKRSLRTVVSGKPIPDQLELIGNMYDEFFDFARRVNHSLKPFASTFKVTNGLTASLNEAEKFVSYNFRVKTNYIDVQLNIAASRSGRTFSDRVDALRNVKRTLRNDVARVDAIGIKHILVKMAPVANSMITEFNSLVNKISREVGNLKEQKFGSFDMFPEYFQIENRSNFSFGKIGSSDWYCFEARGGTFLCKPIQDADYPNYDIIRLTTTTIPKLSRNLFRGGIDLLLSMETQQIDETPEFGTRDGISYNDKKMLSIPVSKNLDYTGANKNYYWEIFFHAPFLIAQTLNTGQKFEEAKEWYEYIYDPTDGKAHWKFLPFTTKPNDSYLKSELDVYLEDPFDPHAIARLRQFAYRKSIVMSYIDNLLDNGDMLFRQYTRESINEARMHYVLAYDLLGKKPESMGVKLLTSDTNYNGLKNESFDYDFLLEKENENGDELMIEEFEGDGEVNRSVISPYFFIPTNELFTDYWGRVEDRLYKIRHCLNIMGIKQALPLFEPPIDPMALVQAAAGGGGFGQVAAGGSVAVPHYRFRFMIAKARELTQKLTQFGGDLLNTLEKKDAEELSMLQNKQEHVILSMTRYIKESQLAEAEENINSLKESHENAKMRHDYYKNLISAGLTAGEEAQIGLMATAAAAHYISSILRIASGIAHIFPEGTIGLFSFGAETGGNHIGSALGGAAETASSLAEGFSITGEVLGMTSQHERTAEDWELQKKMAASDKIQISAQIAGAEIQKKIAIHEITVLEKEIEQKESIQEFMRGKYTNQELYQWMSARLSGMYYQTYQLAFDMAKYAERSFQFERAAKQSDVSFINGMYWDSQKKGLLSGESLELDLDQMEQAFIETDSRRFEITKNVTLLELDPLALLKLRNTGACEFYLSEALFDYDFQGHYSRQVKTISLTFEGDGDLSPFATLTQLSSKTVMEEDVKAVKYLLDPKDTAPTSIRSGWRSNQQVALSHVDEYEKNNGMFELRFDDDRYLPFEGTGAVSAWRLEMNGKKGSFNIKTLKDVTINIKYTALQGGGAFANAVKGLLKPYQANVMFNVGEEFGGEWSNFMNSDANELSLTFTRDKFPNMGGSKIAFIYTKFSLTNQKSKPSLVLNDDDDWTLKDNKFTDTSGLSISGSGTQFNLKLKGKKTDIENIVFVMGYKATV